jgi:hypothetical protein
MWVNVYYNKRNLSYLYHFSNPIQLPTSDSQSSLAEEVSFFFERLEVSGIGVVISVSPNQNLPEELLKLKELLDIPNGLPPCVENARLDFGTL